MIATTYQAPILLGFLILLLVRGWIAIGEGLDE